MGHCIEKMWSGNRDIGCKGQGWLVSHAPRMPRKCLARDIRGSCWLADSPSGCRKVQVAAQLRRCAYVPCSYEMTEIGRLGDWGVARRGKLAQHAARRRRANVSHPRSSWKQQYRARMKARRPNRHLRHVRRAVVMRHTWHIEALLLILVLTLPHRSMRPLSRHTASFTLLDPAASLCGVELGGYEGEQCPREAQCDL